MSVPSNLSVRGEITFLKPDSPKADQFEGESTIYVGDFEGSQSTMIGRPLLESFFNSDEMFEALMTSMPVPMIWYGLKGLSLLGILSPVFYTQKTCELQITICHLIVLDGVI
jgi:hypothetical protein